MLHDVLASSGLAIFAEIGLVVFFLVFVVAVLRVLRGPKTEYESISRLPLEEDDDSVANGTRLHDQRRSET